MKLAECLKIEFRNVQSTFAQAPDQPCMFYFPRRHSRSSDSQVDCFQHTKSIWCSECKWCHASTSFTCPCGIAWHKCTVHFSAPSRMGVHNRPVQPVRGNKRLPPVAAAVSSKRLAILEPNMLTRACIGPRLAARFPHLVSEESPPPGSHHISQDCPRDHHHDRTLSPTHM